MLIIFLYVFILTHVRRIETVSLISCAQGIFGSVKLGARTLGPWKMIPYPLNETSWLSAIEPVEHVVLPAFYRARFTLPDNLPKLLDTYLDTTGWKKVGKDRINIIDRKSEFMRDAIFEMSLFWYFYALLQETTYHDCNFVTLLKSVILLFFLYGKQ